MKRPVILEIALYVALLVVGAGLRIALADLPNFAPVAALALFAGYYFRSLVVAASLPMLVMALSDLVLGGYDYRLMAVVHGTLALPAFARGILRRHGSLDSGTSYSQYGTAVLAGSLFSSCLFFATTNFGSWLWSDIYELNATGLSRCYVAALPFFRYTLAGDLSFALALFGTYAVIHAYRPALLSVPHNPSSPS